jgi:multidrug transporter EmrE-like cation transporter
MMLCGAANGAVNLFVILLSTNKMNPSLMFPLISAGGIVITSLVSIFVYKEKLSLLQYIGVVMGIGAIVFMNL